MRIISANLNKKSNKYSEDLTGYQQNVFWLIDGATPPYTTDKSLVQRFISSLDTGIRQAILSDNSQSLEDIVRSAIEQISSKFTSYDYCPYSTLSIVRVLDSKIEYLVLADSPVYIITDKDKRLITDNRLETVAVEQRNKLYKLISNNESEQSQVYLDASKALIDEELKHQNTDDGYWVAGANPLSASHALQGSVEYGKLFSILIASDGFSRITSSFAKHISYSKLISAIKNSGADKALDYLRSLEDSNCFSNPTPSKHDDASFILVTNN